MTIPDVLLTPLKIIRDERGSVMHMMRADAPYFKSFGEIYFSTVNPGVTKAWKLHASAVGNVAVIDGRLKFVLCDRRETSPSKGTIMEVELGLENYQLLTIPPGIVYGWKNAEDKPAMLANCSSELWRADESKNLPADAIPYQW